MTNNGLLGALTQTNGVSAQCWIVVSHHFYEARIDTRRTGYNMLERRTPWLVATLPA